MADGIKSISSIVFGITILSSTNVVGSSPALVVNTWPWPQATNAAWEALLNSTTNTASLDAVQAGCTKCEEDQCDGTVGFGGSPDENGETTLDAMIMDGTTMNVGAVSCLRRVKNAIGVARHVLDYTTHTMLAGELATTFAIQSGFAEESLSTEKSVKMWEDWHKRNCQPNYRINDSPDPQTSCGPYKPNTNTSTATLTKTETLVSQSNHDTIGMVAIDRDGKVAAGTSTNGMNHKVPGRVGDSPIPGAGSYADGEVGAAVATGDGDVMMRFLPAYQIVESMRQGMKPQKAAEDALDRILKRYETFSGALIGVTKNGEIGAACTGFDQFQFCVRNETMHETKTYTVPCAKIPK